MREAIVGKKRQQSVTSGTFEPSPSRASDALIRDVRNKRAEFGAFTQAVPRDSKDEEIPEDEKEEKDFMYLEGNRYIDDEDTYKVFNQLNMYNFVQLV